MDRANIPISCNWTHLIRNDTNQTPAFFTSLNVRQSRDDSCIFESLRTIPSKNY